MQTKRFGNAILTSGVLMLGMVMAEGCGGTVHAADVDPTVALIAVSNALETAWNQGDGLTYASYFTTDADFINIRGDVFTGSGQIAKVHEMILAGPFKGSHIDIAIRLVKLLAPGVAMLDTDQTVTNFKALPPGVVPTSDGTLVTHFKYIATKQTDGSWKLISGQNTSELPGRMTLPPL